MKQSQTLAAFLAAVLLASCAGGGPCRTDVDCSAREICVQAAYGSSRTRQCERTCGSDTDCLLALRPGTSCRQVQDTAAGPATMLPRDRPRGSADRDATARGALRTCRGPGQGAQK